MVSYTLLHHPALHPHLASRNLDLALSSKTKETTAQIFGDLTKRVEGGPTYGTQGSRLLMDALLFTSTDSQQLPNS